MKDPKTGNPHTAHTTNVVPFIMTGNPKGPKDDPKTLKFAEEVCFSLVFHVPVPVPFDFNVLVFHSRSVNS